MKKLKTALILESPQKEPVDFKLIVNANNDFISCGDTKHLIDKEVKFIKETKSGLALVECSGKEYSIPFRNITIKENE